MIAQDLYKSFVYLYFYIRPVKMFISRTLIKKFNHKSVFLLFEICMDLFSIEYYNGNFAFLIK